jgi:GH15 family glucan-1,4-alpha-glucosidase
MSELVQRSIDLILGHQSPTGAYPACPTFPNYQYSWFRDGSFTAYAMDLVGQHQSAERFFDWSVSVIRSRQGIIDQAVEKAETGSPLIGNEILHTRYTLDGEEAEGEWPNFQLDGFGTWLWAMGQHHDLTQSNLKDGWRQAIDVLAAYISNMWQRPCFDCWEEFPDEVHTYTLAAIHAGLSASERLIDKNHNSTLNEIVNVLLERAVVNDHFVKYIGTDVIDASLLGLSIPYGVFSIDDPLIVRTVESIEKQLRTGGGVHRYAEDSYYGGGEWVLLAAWLGWYYAQRGNAQSAFELKAWIEAQVDEASQLPEQVPKTLNNPNMYQPWVDRWGNIARPLLWSHAMYLILTEALENSHQE